MINGLLFFVPAEKPENVTIMRSFRKSWSLKRDKDKNKGTYLVYIIYLLFIIFDLTPDYDSTKYSVFVNTFFFSFFLLDEYK